MKKTIREIKHALPGLQSEKVEVLADELDRVQSIKKIFSSDEGKQLIDVLKNNCASTLRKLCAALDEKPSLDTLMGLVARYSANLDLNSP